MSDIVNKAPHYQTENPDYEVILVLEKWQLLDSFCLANAIKYISRCRRKGNKEQDIKKAIYYLNKELELDKKKETKT